MDHVAIDEVAAEVIREVARRILADERGKVTVATEVAAEEMSDELGDGVLAFTATSFRGYIAMLQGHHRVTIRATTAALGTLGAHPTQNAYDTLQLAQAYAGLADFREAKNLLRQASDIVTDAGEPPAYEGSQDSLLVLDPRRELAPGGGAHGESRPLAVLGVADLNQAGRVAHLNAVGF